MVGRDLGGARARPAPAPGSPRALEVRGLWLAGLPGAAPMLEFAENPDILAWLGRLTNGRPDLVVGFAAETDDVLANAKAKRLRKGADWIVANDVSPETGIMGGPENAVTLITETGTEPWPRMTKPEVARRLAERIADTLAGELP